MKDVLLLAAYNFKKHTVLTSSRSICFPSEVRLKSYIKTLICRNCLLSYCSSLTSENFILFMLDLRLWYFISMGSFSKCPDWELVEYFSEFLVLRTGPQCWVIEMSLLAGKQIVNYTLPALWWILQWPGSNSSPLRRPTGIASKPGLSI